MYSNMLKGLSCGSALKNLPAMQEMQEVGFNPRVWQMPWRRAWQPTPVFMPGKSYGQRSLAGYSPWGHKESDMAELTAHTNMLKISLLVPSLVCLHR